MLYLLDCISLSRLHGKYGNKTARMVSETLNLVISRPAFAVAHRIWLLDRRYHDGWFYPCNYRFLVVSLTVSRLNCQVIVISKQIFGSSFSRGHSI